MKYALFPVETRDDRTYATITMDFGTENLYSIKVRLLI